MNSFISLNKEEFYLFVARGGIHPRNIEVNKIGNKIHSYNIGNFEYSKIESLRDDLGLNPLFTGIIKLGNVYEIHIPCVAAVDWISDLGHRKIQDAIEHHC